jgi:hypothetical protein
MRVYGVMEANHVLVNVQDTGVQALIVADAAPGIQAAVRFMLIGSVCIESRRFVFGPRRGGCPRVWETNGRKPHRIQP